VRQGSKLDGATCLAIFAAQLESRHLDYAARWLQQQGRGFYTIGFAGHEGNAAVAAAMRPNDPALLHYRSGAFYCARARQVEGIDPVSDVLLGMVAAADEPIAGGRHKVIGRRELAIIRRPQQLPLTFRGRSASRWGSAGRQSSAWPAPGRGKR
jgi:2-oxoisovalerate dehydrogenase E1 component